MVLHCITLFCPVDDGVEDISLSSVSSTLQAFIEGSTLGEFSVRLSMLLGFHCHVLLAPKQGGHGKRIENILLIILSEEIINPRGLNSTNVQF